jgi:putative flippase GtrA
MEMIDRLLKIYRAHKGAILYIFFGGITTMVNWISYYVLYAMMGVSNVAANCIAWVLAVAVAFVTNKIWVFESKSLAPGVMLPELVKFVSCRVGTGVVEILLMFVTVDVAGLPAMLMKVLVSVIVLVLNYVFSKALVFKKAGER